MTKFEEMDAVDQFLLLMTMSKLISETGGGGIEDFAQAVGRTPLDAWPIFCAEAGLDQCGPWIGYPEKPTAASTALSSGAAHARDQITGIYAEMWQDHLARRRANN